MKYRDRSFNLKCPACVAMRRHVLEDWIAFHPLAGHGFSDHRWSTPGAELAHLDDIEAAKTEPKETA